jgi:hypothetical protein
VDHRADRGGGGCSSAQLLGNPGFESGTSPWTATSGVVSTAQGSDVPHSGTHFAWLDGYGRTHTDTLSQSVSIPSDCTTATLSFYLSINSAETTSSSRVRQADRSRRARPRWPPTATLNKTAYTLKSFDLSSFAGQTVTLTFTGVEDSSLQTSFLVDDTSLAVS